MFLQLLLGKQKKNITKLQIHTNQKERGNKNNNNNKKKHHKVTTFSLRFGIYSSISSSAHPEIPKLGYGSGDMAVCCDSGNVSVCGSKAALGVDCLA